jgi:hypothetical protein
MAGFLGKLFGGQDDLVKRIERIMESAEKQDREFKIFRQIIPACLVIGANNVNQRNQLGSEFRKAFPNAQSLQDQFNNLREFIDGTISLGSLDPDIRDDIATQLDIMGHPSIAIMFRDNDDAIYRIMKTGQKKKADLLISNGLGHLID